MSGTRKAWTDYLGDALFLLFATVAAAAVLGWVNHETAHGETWTLEIVSPESVRWDTATKRMVPWRDTTVLVLERGR